MQVEIKKKKKHKKLYCPNTRLSASKDEICCSFSLFDDSYSQFEVHLKRTFFSLAGHFYRTLKPIEIWYSLREHLKNLQP